MEMNDLNMRDNDLEKEFARIEAHARSRFEHEEFLASAKQWKECAAIAKELRRDDLRALAYRHLSFALRGCGQIVQADEAYRRAMKYETRSSQQSPSSRKAQLSATSTTQGDGDANDHRRSPSIAASSDADDIDMLLRSSRSSAALAAAAAAAPTSSEIEAHRVANYASILRSPVGSFVKARASFQRSRHVDMKDDEDLDLDLDLDLGSGGMFGRTTTMLSLEEYEAGLQSLAEANARQRDRIEHLEKLMREKNAVMEELDTRAIKKIGEVEELETLAREEKMGQEAMETEIYELKKSFEHQSETTERERKGYESTIETLRASLMQEQEESLKSGDELVDQKDVAEKLSLELKDANVMIAGMQVKTFKYECELKERNEMMEENQKKRKILEEKCQMMEEESETRQGRIVTFEREQENNTHQMTKIRSLTLEISAKRDEIALRLSDIKKLERMNEDIR